MFHLLLLLPVVSALVAYDCETQIANVTKFSLIDDVQCFEYDSSVVSEEVRIQLVAEPEYDFVHVYECKVTLWRHVQQFPNGQWMMKHSITPQNGEMTFSIPVSRSACMEMHVTKHFSYGTKLNVNDLQSNTTREYSVQLAGLWTDGVCNTEPYVDQIGSYTNTCTSGKIKVSLLDYTAKVSIHKNTLYLNTGQSCALDSDECQSISGNQAYWERYAYSACDKRAYDVYYTGLAQKYTSKQDGRNVRHTYIVKQPDKAFSLDAISDTRLCGQTAFVTEHPKFKIVEYKSNNYQYVENEERKEINLNIFTYLNMKFTTYDKHINEEFDSLYRHWRLNSCKQRQQNHKFLRAIARYSPEVFAYHVMGKPGYTAHVLGEVAHIIQCTRVDVKLRDVVDCYLDLPVAWNNKKNYFMTPFNHILTTQSNKYPCNPDTPMGYYLGGSWITGKKKEKLEVGIIDLMKPTDWHYHEEANLMTSGVYTLPELDKFNEHLLAYDSVKTRIVNEMPRIGPSIQMVNDHNVLLNNPEAILLRYYNKLFYGWNWLATNMSAVVGIYFIFRFILWLFSRLFNLRRLYRKHGWSWKMLKFMSTNATLASVLKNQQCQELQPLNNRDDTINIDTKIMMVPPTAPVFYSPQPVVTSLYPNVRMNRPASKRGV